MTDCKLLRRWRVSVAILGALAMPLLAPAQPTAAAGESAATSAGGTDLPEARPAEVGVDTQKLIQLSQWIREQNLDVRSLLVVKDGKLVFERYSGGLDRGYNYELYSITKGVTAILAGMLIEEGKLRLDDKIVPILAKARPDLAQKLGDKQDLEVRHILSMSSGLHYDFKPPNDPIYYDAPDRMQLAADTQPKVKPGTEFEYTDINPILTAAVLSAAAGMPIEQYAKAKLFEPMGFQNYAWGRADKKGLGLDRLGAPAAARRHGEGGAARAPGRQLAGQTAGPGKLDQADDFARRGPLFRLLLVDQQYRDERTRGRHDGLQGPVHHRAAEA